MESLLARALESKLKHWLKSFSRDQFKLQGRSVQLHNLDVNGDVLHSTLGLPPSLSVAQAKIGKLELKIPYISNVLTEPIIVEIDKLDLVLVEKSNSSSHEIPSSGNQAVPSGRNNSYGFADQIADGMTVEVRTLNLMLETRGGSRGEGGAAWTPPLASITMRGLKLFTTNQNWQVVNLKDARSFSSDKKCIYVFKKLEWDSISIDLLPHPDMFADKMSSVSSRRDSDGAKRLFFGGERFLDNISGSAYITMHRTDQNNSLGLEVQLLIPEVVCPALSEPGLRALLRFMTGFYVCLNRGDISPTSNQQVEESPCATKVSVNVEHIFLGLKDADLRLELLMQSFQYVRASIPDGDRMKTLAKLSLTGFFLRDTFTQPSCTLVQPSMLNGSLTSFDVPKFAEEWLWPKIYPLPFQLTSKPDAPPLLCMYSSQIIPSPAPPALASQSVIQCQPLRIELQEKACLQIASFLADGVVVERGAVLPDTSLNSTHFTLREFDLTIPLRDEQQQQHEEEQQSTSEFTGAWLHVKEFVFAEGPSVTYSLLKLDEDAACFALWRGQIPDSSQKRIVVKADELSVSLEMKGADRLWHCIQMHGPCVEIAMITADGSPLVQVPPPRGTVRLGVMCKRFISNTSVEQLLFVLRLYSYVGEVGESLMGMGLSSAKSMGGLVEAAPADSAVTLGLEIVEVKFVEDDDVAGALVSLSGSGLCFKVMHRTLGGAIAVSSTLRWQSVCVECVDDDDDGRMRGVFWVEEKGRAFVDVSAVHVIPYEEEGCSNSLKVSAKVCGVRMGGGMVYNELLLHRFGIFGEDGGTGHNFRKIIATLSTGPFSKVLLRQSRQNISQNSEEGNLLSTWRKPDDVEVEFELIDWLFALEGANAERGRERERGCWHTAFQRLYVGCKKRSEQVQRLKLSIEGLQALKPKAAAVVESGLNVEVRLVVEQRKENGDFEWNVESIRTFVKEPVEMEASRIEVEHLVKVGKAEIEAASRISAGILKVLEIEEVSSAGQAAIEKLNSIGSGSVDKYVIMMMMKKEKSKVEESVLRSQQLCEKIENEMMMSSVTCLSDLRLLADELKQIQCLISKH